jgi:hypothetical protein
MTMVQSPIARSGSAHTIDTVEPISAMMVTAIRVHSGVVGACGSYSSRASARRAAAIASLETETLSEPAGYSKK